MASNYIYYRNPKLKPKVKQPKLKFFFPKHETEFSNLDL